MSTDDSIPLPAGVRTQGSATSRRITLDLFDSLPGLVHGFTLAGSDPVAVLRDATTQSPPLLTLRQVHGRTVIGVDDNRPERYLQAALEADALTTGRADRALGILVADCAPVLICDPRRRALAAVHAGWRGTVAGIVPATIAVMRRRYDSDPADLYVGIGPSIGTCCFEVGDEVTRSLLQYDPGAGDCIDRRSGRRPHVDLAAANRRQALTAGVQAERIAVAGLCTACRADLLPSYRRQGASAGRIVALITWPPAT